MKLATLGTYLALAALAAVVFGVGAGGCEAIVSDNVPPYVPSSTCSMTPYIDAGVGTCAQGSFCEGAGCAPCNPKGDDPCDGYDNDCDGIIDDGPKSDHDGDGYTNCGNPANLLATLDCNDDDKTIHPKGHEICNGKDDNCDGIIDNPDLVCPANETCVPSTGQCISNSAVCVSCATSSTPGCCASPNVCDPSTQQCVAPASQDAGATGCISNVQCATGFCATATELGPGQPSLCTQSCCTSADCTSLGSGYVCYAAGTGGNYCVSAASLGRTPPPTCCSDSDCSGGNKCTVVASGSQAGFACQTPPGTKGATSSCNQDSDCTSGYCQTYNVGFGQTASYCIAPCCSSKACGSLQGNVMLCYDDYYPPSASNGQPSTSGPVVPVCDYPQPGSGKLTGNVGDTCTQNSDCFSNRCLQFGSAKNCSDVCCRDADCGKAGWVCQPTVDGPVTGLRCVPAPVE